MKSFARIERTRDELREALTEQVTLLISYCEHFDKGERAFAKPIAVALRICLHHKNRSNALLQQLNLRSGYFYSVAGRVKPKAIPIGCLLVCLAHTPDKGGHYAPVLDVPTTKNGVPFPEWWTGTILHAPTGATMSRMDIVTAVADTDGGAHIDPGLDKSYAAFRCGELLGQQIERTETGDIRMHLPIFLSVEAAAMQTTDGLLASPEYPSIRTIAHELLLTLQKSAPWSFKGKQYAP